MVEGLKCADVRGINRQLNIHALAFRAKNKRVAICKEPAQPCFGSVSSLLIAVGGSGADSARELVVSDESFGFRAEIITPPLLQSLPASSVVFT